MERYRLEAAVAVVGQLLEGNIAKVELFCKIIILLLLCCIDFIWHDNVFAQVKQSVVEWEWQGCSIALIASLRKHLDQGPIILALCAKREAKLL